MKLYSALGFLSVTIAVKAQQYAGTTIKNSLPSADGSAISFFNVRDSSGRNSTLINYFSSGSNGTRQDSSKVQRAVVILHGQNRDAGPYFTRVFDSLGLASSSNTAISPDTVAIISPLLANKADARTAYPVSGSTPTVNVLVWSDVDWYGGANNIYPAGNQKGTISSYDVVDQILLYFNDAAVYPNLKQIVVAGHSMGAQMTHRYAAIGRNLGLNVPLQHWIGNPNSFVWLNSSRPVAAGTCKTPDDWPEGLSNYDSGGYTYNGELVAQGSTAIQSNYAGKHINYARALKDFGDASKTCAPYSQGDNRGERFYSFLTYFPPGSDDTVDYEPSLKHDPTNMINALSGQTRLFLDNWDGDGSKAADFGPRQIAGDDPHPSAT